LKIPNPKELDIRLLLSASKKLVEDGEHGNVVALYESFIGERPHKFKITIQRDMPWTWTLNTFAHEMVHVWQHATGRLRKKYSNGTWLASWCGLAWTDPDTVLYRHRPWEVEARSKEAWLVQSFYMVEKTTGIVYSGS
jgi:hypothetical protein